MTARSKQSILKEINPEYSLERSSEGLMLKLKFQYFGHLMRRADSFEKTLMLRKIEGRKRRGQEYTEELHKTYLNDPDNHDGVITHLEPYILECQVKWVLGSITTNKASGGDGIPAELFQILKDDAVKCCSQFSSDTQSCPTLMTQIAMMV